MDLRVVGFGALLAACGSSGNEPATVAGGDDAARAPVVVVELFTSQGCNSCPPADAVLSELGKPGAVDGVEIIPLAYHVDYWNDLGWDDPFSSGEWSRRQRAYSRTLPNGRVYTPQLVIAGREHVVGSKRASVTRAVRRAADHAVIPAEVDLDVADAGDELSARVRLSAGAALDTGELDLVVVLYDSGASTDVPRGENAGRELHNDFIVRRLVTAGAIRAGERSVDAAVTLDIDEAWNRDDVGVVAFAQDSATREIVAATVWRRRATAAAPSTP